MAHGFAPGFLVCSVLLISLAIVVVCFALFVSCVANGCLSYFDATT
jgi:hypothetical protein